MKHPSATNARQRTESGRALCFDGRALRLEAGMCPDVPAPSEELFTPLHVLVGPRDLAACAPGSQFRGIPGHRTIGAVHRAGPGHNRRVPSPHIVCGVCDLCRRGLASHCRLRRTIGLDRRDGVLAERVSLPASNLRAVPAGLDDEVALFALDAARAAHVAHRISVEARTFVTVLGDGPLALITAQMLARRNASVRCLGRRASCYELCERWGVKHRHADEAGRRRDQDVVLVCSDDPAAQQTAVEMIRPRGSIAFMPPSGVLHPGPDVINAAVQAEVVLIGVAWGEIDEGLAALATGEIEVLPLITARFRFSDALQAFAAAREPDALAAVIHMN